MAAMRQDNPESLFHEMALGSIGDAERRRVLNEYLLDAARAHAPRCVAALLDAGADPNWSDLGCTPLVQAVDYNDAVITSMLLSRGADPNAQIINIETVLFRAVRDNNLAMVKLLLAHGADPHARGELEVDIVQRAAAAGAHKTLLYLLKRLRLLAKRQNQMGMTAFEMATKGYGNRRSRRMTLRILEKHGN